MAKKLSRRRLLQLASSASIALLTGCDLGSGDDEATTGPATPTIPTLTSVEGYSDPRRWEGRTLVVATPGEEGTEYLQAQVAAIFEPFERLTGAIVETVRTDIALLRQQVESAEVVWSVCDVPAEEVLSLANSAIVDDIDYEVVDASDLFEPFVMPQGVGANLYATALAYSKPELASDKQPTNWTDYWDLDMFPGLRGFQESALGTLEFALLGSGVSIADLYPLDIETAFRRLDLIVDQIALWWRQGAQPTQMIAAGDLAMVAVWHDRILELAMGGAEVDLTWNQSQINGDSWVVPNGSPEREMAMDFVNFATRPEVTATFSKHFPFGPVNSRAHDLLAGDDMAILPGAPEIVDKQFVVDLEWWFRNREPVDELFREWLEEQPVSS